MTTNRMGLEQEDDYGLSAQLEVLEALTAPGDTENQQLICLLLELKQRRANTTPPLQAVPTGWKLVPIEPTENMVVEGFESEPDSFFSHSDEWEAYKAMSGCQQAAHKSKLCWAAMIAAAPSVTNEP